MPKIGVRGGFVDRGDPSAWDYTLSNLTTDGNWHDLDLSSIVPAGARAASIILYINHASVGQGFWMRKKGNVNSINMTFSYTQVANAAIIYDLIVGLDSNRKAQYTTNNTTFNGIYMCIKGWFL